ncbi:hypothetical protein SAMN05443633_101140 [Chryseobacterium arachidis]|uniref:CarboxypepD_reg-like domain-containing protein n=1 Tax=Chryseobacterium arachidis TaxID=1416778 RepID=A0A1M4T2S8_9FLAO|nr:hypothetical protein [Chryseobacterium arachidis]SHE38749.1 hypothetical protein SAMN05443633_101140 [Chryseobacterium arachidis]
MSKLILIVLAANLISCSEKYGYIYDAKTKRPLEGVFVSDTKDISKKYVTKSDGMFSFSECNDLMIEKKGYKTDTLEKYGCKPNGKCFDGHIFYMEKNK